MQRSLLPILPEAFPNASFIIATHSPLIIGSVKDSKTYVLKNTGEKNEIISLELDIKKKSGSANDLLREVLGVPISIPIWAEEELDKIIKKYSETPLNEENYSKLMNELKQFDLDIWFPETLKNVVSQIDQKGKINKT